MNVLRIKNLKCEPCTGNSSLLTTKEINNYLKQLLDWEINENKDMIFKKFKFSNYKKPLLFVNTISNLAEKEGHHPDISFGWGYCLIMLHTHAINNLSINDFILASKIDDISIK